MNLFPETAISRELKQRTMRRVYAVWFWRSVAPLLAVEAALIVGVAAGVLAHISLRHILLNALAASSDAWAFVKFFVSNFFVKSIQSRLLLAVYAALLLLFARDIRSAVRRMRGLDAGDFLSFALAGGNRPRSTRVT